MQSDGTFDMRKRKNRLATYLRSKDIEVPGPVSATDELAFVLGRDS